MIPRPDNWPKWIRDPLPVDWPEDSVDTDNGCYQQNCSSCRVLFFGHKRRYVCKSCSKAAEERWNALTPEQQTIERQEAFAAIDRLLGRSS